MRRATRHNKLDANHLAVVKELRSRGVEVVEIQQPVDLLCFLNNRLLLIEVKPEGRGTYTKLQLTFMSTTRMPVAIARTAQEAIDCLKTGVGLSQRQKDAIAGFLVRNTADKFNSEQIDRLLAG